MKNLEKYLESQNIKFEKVSKGYQFKRDLLSFDIRKDLEKLKTNIGYLDTTIYITLK